MYLSDRDSGGWEQICWTLASHFSLSSKGESYNIFLIPKSGDAVEFRLDIAYPGYKADPATTIYDSRRGTYATASVLEEDHLDSMKTTSIHVKIRNHHIRVYCDLVTNLERPSSRSEDKAHLFFILQAWKKDDFDWLWPLERDWDSTFDPGELDY